MANDYFSEQDGRAKIQANAWQQKQDPAQAELLPSGVESAGVTNNPGNMGLLTSSINGGVKELVIPLSEGGNADVVLNGSHSQPAGRPISSYVWSIQGGGVGSGPTYTINVDQDTAVYVELTVSDSVQTARSSILVRGEVIAGLPLSLSASPTIEDVDDDEQEQVTVSSGLNPTMNADIQRLSWYVDGQLGVADGPLDYSPVLVGQGPHVVSAVLYTTSGAIQTDSINITVLPPSGQMVGSGRVRVTSTGLGDESVAVEVQLATPLAPSDGWRLVNLHKVEGPIPRPFRTYVRASNGEFSLRLITFKSEELILSCPVTSVSNADDFDTSQANTGLIEIDGLTQEQVDSNRGTSDYGWVNPFGEPAFTFNEPVTASQDLTDWPQLIGEVGVPKAVPTIASDLTDKLVRTYMADAQRPDCEGGKFVQNIARDSTFGIPIDVTATYGGAQWQELGFTGAAATDLLLAAPVVTTARFMDTRFAQASGTFTLTLTVDAWEDTGNCAPTFPGWTRAYSGAGSVSLESNDGNSVIDRLDNLTYTPQGLALGGPETYDGYDLTDFVVSMRVTISSEAFDSIIQAAGGQACYLFIQDAGLAFNDYVQVSIGEQTRFTIADPGVAQRPGGFAGDFSQFIDAIIVQTSTPWSVTNPVTDPGRISWISNDPSEEPFIEVYEGWSDILSNTGTGGTGGT